MKERPILFSAPMVRAILEGRKTQTRRVAKVNADDCKPGYVTPNAGFTPRTIEEHVKYCPYGQPGDRLWVRETWRTAKSLDKSSAAVIAESCIHAGYRKPWAPIQYAADGSRINWDSSWGDSATYVGRSRPSIHMPRFASRITLEITDVRVERLQDISNNDALEEGTPDLRTFENNWDMVRCYQELWESINGVESWAANPWVWVIEFKRINP